tara:strand:+ start:953 stop:1621 length:669 start_codon:yes stop_codon:yes gene_type:complete
MKKIIAAVVAAAAVALPALSDPLKDNEFKTMHSMGCMLLQECTEDVEKVFSINDIAYLHPDTDFNIVADEFHSMLVALEQVGVDVFLADEKYFPVGHRGVYHTVGNNFFLNKSFMTSPGTLMMVMRHEGWHAAQDCMAGTIENSMIAIIMPEDDVPMIWRVLAKRTYPENAVPWEAEAGWAGRTEKMTQEALESCARGTMWTDYDPTPMTREWLVKNGYLSK